MKVSLYIPVFNAEKTIATCIEAVLKQTYPVDEIVVVDDGSSDRSAGIISEYPVKLIQHQGNKGLAVARNTAVKNCSSQLIASLDSDCVPDQEWLGNLVENLSLSGSCGVGGRLEEKFQGDLCDLWRATHLKQHWGDNPCDCEFLFGANTLFYKQKIMDVGLYNEKLKTNYEDVELCQRLKDGGDKFSYEPKALVHHYRKDTICSLMDTYWRWYRAYYEREDFYKNEEKLISKINDNIGLANRYIEDDLNSGRTQLVYLDFLLAFHHCLRDLEYFAYTDNNDSTNNFLLKSWLSLVDLVFSYHMSHGNDNLFTFVKDENAFLQNTLALQLVLGQAVNQKFESALFSKLTHKHLIFSLYGVIDNELIERITLLVNQHGDWRGLYKQNHDYLNKRFLEMASVEFPKWFNKLIFCHKSIKGVLLDSAQKIEQNLKI